MKILPPNILTTKMVSVLPQEVLNLLPQVSTDIVMEYITRFTSANAESADSEVALAVRKLNVAYKDRFDRNEYLSSKAVKDVIDELKTMDLLTIAVISDVETLKTYYDVITEYLGRNDSEVSKTQSYMVSLRFSEENLYNVCEDIRKLISKYPANESEIRNLIYGIESNKNIFTKITNNAEQTNKFNQLRVHQDNLRILQYSIKFKIDRLTSGDLSDWRKF